MKNLKKIVSLLLILAVLLSLVACGEKKPEGLWSTATYLKDTTVGEGAKTLLIKVEAEEKSIIITVKTDKKTVGEALLEHSIIQGDMGDYGLYVKYVNGIKADYDTDKAYWGFYKNGEYMMTGVDTTEFESGQQYELVYTKG
jgi:hypothetical protein